MKPNITRLHVKCVKHQTIFKMEENKEEQVKLDCTKDPQNDLQIYVPLEAK